MTAHYQRVKALFQEALECASEHDRRTFLEARCGGDDGLLAEVEELLALHASDGATFETDLAAPASPLPEAIGPYRILRRLGEGGMGAVFEAEQRSPRRRVALKLLRGAFASRALLQRFELEGQLLGRLQHPGIAQIFDAGLTSAVSPEPYFVMELVQGLSLTRHARDAGLDTAARVELFALVCDAVEHAHQRGVIHRDLKPDNVLVDPMGQPKVLDFGIARAIDGENGTSAARTGTGQLIGTLAYMSPEQATGERDEIDTRTDIYSLGILLFELLAERLPYRVDGVPLSTALRTIAEGEPQPLGSVERRLAGDLEIIVARAIEKEKERRYASVGALASDLRRYLADEPITARRATTLYQLKKFTRRHGTLVFAAVTVFLAVVIGLAVSTRMYVLAERRRVDAVEAGQRERVQRDAAFLQRTLAQTRADQAEAVTVFLVDALGQADPFENLEAGDLRVRDMLDAAARRIPGAFEGEPAIESAVRLVIASAYQSLGELDRALGHAQRAVELRRNGPLEQRAGFAAALRLEALIQLGRAELDAAQVRIDEALASARAASPERSDDPELLAALSLSGYRALAAGELSEARAAFEGVLARLDQAGREAPATRAEALNNLSSVATAERDTARALDCAEQALVLSREAYGAEHINVAVALNNVGVTAYANGDHERALECMFEALRMRRAILGDDHAETASLAANLAVTLAPTHPAQALELYEGALVTLRARLGGEHPSVATLLNNHALLLKQLRHYDAALESYAESLAIRRAALGPEHIDIAVSLHNLATLFEAQGDCEAALPYAEECLEMRASTLPADHPDLALAEALYQRLLDRL